MTTTRPVPLIAALVVLVGAFAAIAIAVHRFNSHQGLPTHIGAGAVPGHAAAGEPVVISGVAVGAAAGTKLDLLEAQAPFKHGYRPIASLRLGRSHGFRFVIHPRRRAHYRVAASVDHQLRSRMVSVVVQPR